MWQKDYRALAGRNLDWNPSSAIYLLTVLLWEGFLTSLGFSFPHFKDKSKNTRLIDWLWGWMMCQKKAECSFWLQEKLIRVSFLFPHPFWNNLQSLGLNSVAFYPLHMIFFSVQSCVCFISPSNTLPCFNYTLLIILFHCWLKKNIFTYCILHSSIYKAFHPQISTLPTGSKNLVSFLYASLYFLH